MIRDRLAATGKRFYCIAFTVRSGSSLLCEDLTQWGLGAPTEHFQFPAQPVLSEPIADYLTRVVDGSPGGWYGLKITWSQVHGLTSRLRSEGDTSVGFDLRTVFPDLKFVYIERKDLIGQALSAWRAGQSGTWHWPVGQDVDKGRPALDYDAVLIYLQSILTDNWLWRSHFEELGETPYEMIYEEYIQDRPSRLEHLCRWLGWEGEPVPLEDRLNVMRDDWTAQMSRAVKGKLYEPPDVMESTDRWAERNSGTSRPPNA